MNVIEIFNDITLWERLRLIIKHYGLRHQLRKLMEESYELCEAIEDYNNADSRDAYRDHIVEELSDCLCVVFQFVQKYSVNLGELSTQLPAFKFKRARPSDILVKAYAVAVSVLSCQPWNAPWRAADVRYQLTEYILTVLSCVNWEANLAKAVDTDEVRAVIDAKTKRQIARIEEEK